MLGKLKESFSRRNKSGSWRQRGREYQEAGGRRRLNLGLDGRPELSVTATGTDQRKTPREVNKKERRRKEQTRGRARRGGQEEDKGKGTEEEDGGTKGDI